MTTHTIINTNSNNLSGIDSNSINLIVTSPPYPMISMWDELFSSQDQTISQALNDNDGCTAFHKMHALLNSIWDECDRVLCDNGFICINIGDATRTINNVFQLYSNHTEIINYFSKKGYSVLPDIHWRKQTNSPNKYMGSGMYPAGAYVTYEHEYILIFRKGEKRKFSGKDKEERQESAYFWEERNIWFSDLWELKGTSQLIKKSNTSRNRNASFPLEVPYRLINMYSKKNDIILDPFCGLGTTNLACMLSERNSIGIELFKDIQILAYENLKSSFVSLNDLIEKRLEEHSKFISTLPEEKLIKCYDNIHHGFKVKTKQEIKIKINKIKDITEHNGVITCLYED